MVSWNRRRARFTMRLRGKHVGNERVAECGDMTAPAGPTRRRGGGERHARECSFRAPPRSPRRKYRRHRNDQTRVDWRSGPVRPLLPSLDPSPHGQGSTVRGLGCPQPGNTGSGQMHVPGSTGATSRSSTSGHVCTVSTRVRCRAARSKPAQGLKHRLVTIRRSQPRRLDGGGRISIPVFE